MQSKKSQPLSGAHNKRLKSHKPIKSEGTAAWANIDNLRNDTGDNGKFITLISYTGMTDMYGNEILADNGNVSYAQFLVNQAKFKISETTTEQETLINKNFNGIFNEIFTKFCSIPSKNPRRKQ